VNRGRAAAGSALFLAAAPGVMAGVVPWLLTGWDRSEPGPSAVAVGTGIVLVASGAGALLHAFWRFVADGLGTPAPIAPTETLVVRGLYRYVRNPMYVAVAATIAGQALVLGRPVLLAYAAAFLAVTAAFVRRYEEPALRRTHGAAYEEYRARVPAWVPSLRRSRV
jgi:protein-S-isoprenylcysteine O-methyltransferase Ste14